jgi:hypothetical protein
VIIIAHGIEFVRTGSCQHCGDCGCNKGPCPHWYVHNGRRRCAIYDVRQLTCKVCSEIDGERIDHVGCVGFPDNPWVRVVRNRICGYTFQRTDGGSMDDLPFLNGEPYLK